MLLRISAAPRARERERERKRERERESERVSAEELTDHVDGGSPGPHPMMLLDGFVESGLTQLNGSHTDPEAQAEQPRHDRTHLLRTDTALSQTHTHKKKIHHVPNL